MISIIGNQNKIRVRNSNQIFTDSVPTPWCPIPTHPNPFNGDLTIALKKRTFNRVWSFWGGGHFFEKAKKNIFMFKLSTDVSTYICDLAQTLLIVAPNYDITQFLYGSSAVRVPLYKIALFLFLAPIIPIPGAHYSHSWNVPFPPLNLIFPFFHV